LNATDHPPAVSTGFRENRFSLKFALPERRDARQRRSIGVKCRATSGQFLFQTLRLLSCWIAEETVAASHTNGFQSLFAYVVEKPKAALIAQMFNSHSKLSKTKGGN
jgi:hypothetical protein